MKVDSAEINNVLAQMRALAAQARGPEQSAGADKAAGTDFGDLLKQSLDHVNQKSAEAKELTTAFEQGDPNVDLANVMIAMQKSSISFQAMLQVRNRLIEAYKDIKSMSI